MGKNQNSGPADNNQPPNPDNAGQPGADNTGQPAMDAAGRQPGALVGTSPKHFTIEELRVRKNTPAPVFSGVCAAYGWRPGKMVTEESYDEAVTTFSKAPIGRKVQ